MKHLINLCGGWRGVLLGVVEGLTLTLFILAAYWMACAAVPFR